MSYKNTVYERLPSNVKFINSISRNHTQYGSHSSVNALVKS